MSLTGLSVPLRPAGATLAAVVAAEKAVSFREAFSKWVDRILFSGVCVLLFFGPLAFGAVEDWSLFVVELGAAILFLLWSVKQLLSPGAKIKGNVLYPPMIVFGVVIASQVVWGISVYRHATLSELYKYIAYGMLFFLVVHCVQTEERLRRFVNLLTGFGFVLAVFGVIQALTSNGKLYWLVGQPGGLMYGTYVNHNHYAGLMEMLVPLALTMSMTRSITSGRRMFLALAGIVMGGTIFLCLSRGGIVAFLWEVSLLVLFLAWKRNGRKAIGFGVLLLLTAAFLFWMGREQTLDRLASLRHPTEEIAAKFRLTVAQDGLRMFRERPIAGWGLGGFPVVYPQFRSFYSQLYVDPADNDWLQLLVETGLLGCAVTGWFLLGMYRWGLRRLDPWTADLSSAVTLAALIGCTGVLIHSFSDSNLHVPANAGFFYVLCALATIQVQGLGASNASKRAREKEPGWR